MAKIIKLGVLEYSIGVNGQKFGDKIDIRTNLINPSEKDIGDCMKELFEIVADQMKMTLTNLFKIPTELDLAEKELQDLGDRPKSKKHQLKEFNARFK